MIKDKQSAVLRVNTSKWHSIDRWIGIIHVMPFHQQKQKLFKLVEFPSKVMFKPNKHYVAELEKKDYLGKAKVILLEHCTDVTTWTLLNCHPVLWNVNHTATNVFFIQDFFTKWIYLISVLWSIVIKKCTLFLGCCLCGSSGWLLWVCSITASGDMGLM